MRARLLCGVAGAAALFAVGTLSPSLAGAAQLSAHGQFIHPSLNSSTSSNWFGYNVGALERHTLFHSITGVWTVPTATQHTAGQAEDWRTGSGSAEAVSTPVARSPTAP